MTTWILILTIASDVYSGTQVNVQSIPGFATEAACIEASKRWAAQVNTTDRYDRPRWTRALCARTAP